MPRARACCWRLSAPDHKRHGRPRPTRATRGQRPMSGRAAAFSTHSWPAVRTLTDLSWDCVVCHVSCAVCVVCRVPCAVCVVCRVSCVVCRVSGDATRADHHQITQNLKTWRSRTPTQTYCSARSKRCVHHTLARTWIHLKHSHLCRGVHARPTTQFPRTFLPELEVRRRTRSVEHCNACLGGSPQFAGELDTTFDACAAHRPDREDTGAGPGKKDHDGPDQAASVARHVRAPPHTLPHARAHTHTRVRAPRSKGPERKTIHTQKSVPCGAGGAGALGSRGTDLCSLRVVC
jgi:hypothetical protein